MYRRFIFPAIAVTAWAQQPSPDVAAAEAALRGRVQQFFQLQVEKKYRQAEALVAEGSRDEYYTGNGQYKYQNFSIQKVELLDNTRAKVTIAGDVVALMPGAGPIVFKTPSITTWIIENGQWSLFIDPAAKLQTPFGTLKPGPGDGKPGPLNMQGKAPDVATLQGLVKIDRNSVVLTPGAPPQGVTISNGLPGGVNLEVDSAPIAGVSFELEKKYLEAGEKTVIWLRATGEAKGAGVVSVRVSPVVSRLDIRVEIN